MCEPLHTSPSIYFAAANHRASKAGAVPSIKNSGNADRLSRDRSRSPAGSSATVRRRDSFLSIPASARVEPLKEGVLPRAPHPATRRCGCGTVRLGAGPGTRGAYCQGLARPCDAGWAHPVMEHGLEKRSPSLGGPRVRRRRPLKATASVDAESAGPALTALATMSARASTVSP
jgi:hypothetical protein